MKIITLDINVYDFIIQTPHNIYLEFTSNYDDNHIVFRDIDIFSRTIYWEFRSIILSNANINNFTKLI